MSGYEDFQEYRDWLMDTLDERGDKLFVAKRAREEGMTVESYLCRENGGPCNRPGHKCIWRSFGVRKQGFVRDTIARIAGSLR